MATDGRQSLICVVDDYMRYAITDRDDHGSLVALTLGALDR